MSACWLLKTEPSTYSWGDLVTQKKAVWDGVTNALALKNIRAMKKGDAVFIYHTGDEKAAVGIARVANDPYPGQRRYTQATIESEISMLLQGIFPPITTPFYPDGNVYFKKLEHNVERYSKTPVAGIVVLGSTGEAIMLSDDERREGLESCAGSGGAKQGADRRNRHRVGHRDLAAHRVCGRTWLRRSPWCALRTSTRE